MASSAPDVAALKIQLYEACLNLTDNPKAFFNQATIFDLGIIPNNDVNILLKVTQALVDERLFKILQSEGLAWRLRTQEEARKSVSLPSSLSSTPPYPTPHSVWFKQQLTGTPQIPQSQTRARNSLQPNRRGRLRGNMVQDDKNPHKPPRCRLPRRDQGPGGEVHDHGYEVRRASDEEDVYQEQLAAERSRDGRAVVYGRGAG